MKLQSIGSHFETMVQRACSRGGEEHFAWVVLSRLGLFVGLIAPYWIVALVFLPLTGFMPGSPDFKDGVDGVLLALATVCSAAYAFWIGRMIYRHVRRVRDTV